MKKNTAQRALIASILSITATAWAQTPVNLGRANDPDPKAKSHMAKPKGDGPAHSLLVLRSKAIQRPAPDDAMR